MREREAVKIYFSGHEEFGVLIYTTVSLSSDGDDIGTAGWETERGAAGEVFRAHPPLAVHQTSFVLILIPQVPSEANPINMVAKLSQLTSLLSSIEDKVLTDPPASLAFVCSPVCTKNVQVPGSAFL